MSTERQFNMTQQSIYNLVRELSLKIKKVQEFCQLKPHAEIMENPSNSTNPCAQKMRKTNVNFPTSQIPDCPGVIVINIVYVS